MTNSSPPLDIIGLGDAIVDVLARRDDAFLAACGVPKGTMRLLTDAEAETLAQAMAGSGPVDEVPGGSAANTLAGAAALGAHCGFAGQVGDDRLGRLFAGQMEALGVVFATPPIAHAPTGRCFVIISPDGERTMQTSPAASHHFAVEALDEAAIAAAKVLFLEGYLWGPERPRAAMRRAMEVARGAGRTIAFTLSDSIALPGRREDLARLVADGWIDLLFANEHEARLIAGDTDTARAIDALTGRVSTLVVTRGARGALLVADGECLEVPAVKVASVVDTTGAGDQFAAGFLAAMVRGGDPAACLTAGTRAAANVIGHVGARPRAAARNGDH